MTKRSVEVVTALAGMALLAGCSGARLPTKATGETVLTVRGQVKEGPYFLQRSDLAGLPRAGFRAHASGAPADARYDGVSLQRLLEERLRPTEGADTLVFVTKDGLTLPITGALIRQYGPILADQVDGRPVPPQLAWPNLDQRGLDADPRAALWWTGPVEVLEVVAWDRTWGRALRPPPGISDPARLGAGQYAMRCAACHRLHGLGGQRGPALDGAVGRLGLAGFVGATQRHPGWPARVGAELTSGDDVAGQVAAFLSAADLAGLQAVDETKPPASGPPRRPGY
jgi:hypothetical protein